MLTEMSWPAVKIAVSVGSKHVVWLAPVMLQLTAVSVPLFLTVNVQVFPAPGATSISTRKFWTVPSAGTAC